MMKAKLKDIIKLKQKKYREKENKFILEGIRNIEEALISKINIYSFFYTAQLLKNKRGLRLYKNIQKEQIKSIRITIDELNKISDTSTPQGVLGVCEKIEYDFREFIKKNIRSLVILDSIQDPGNLGTIIRTADAAGADGVIVSKGTVDVYNPKVLNATMGSLGHLPVIEVEDLVDSIKKLKEKRIKILACDLRGKKNYNEVNYKGPIGIIFGNEGAGIRREIINLADEVMKIPIRGKAESLNVGVSCGIVLYNMLETRGEEN